MIIVLTVAAFIVSAVLTYRFIQPRSPFYVLDHPNERSLHTRPTPRIGGVAILLTICICAAVALVDSWGEIIGFGWLTAATLLVAVLSFLDDLIGLTISYRLAGQFVAAGLLLYGGLTVPVLELPGMMLALPSPGMALLLGLFIVWMVNLYNFMDGMDGFAGGMTVIGFGTFGLLGALADAPSFAMLSWIIAAAAVGFLVWNFPPAKIFMGDTGSATLGFVAAAFALWAAKEHYFPVWVAVLVFSPFIVDATVTLVRRAVRKEKFWRAHKSHYYQRLVQFGWGHRKTVLWEYVLMGTCAASAVWATYLTPPGQWILIGMWIMIYFVLAVAVGRLERRRR